MAVYEYRGIQIASGKAVKGVRDAESAKALRTLLRKEGVLLSSAVEDSKKVKKSAGEIDVFAIFKRANSDDVAMITRQLATLIKAGIPLVDSIGALTEQIEKQDLKRILTTVRERLNEGSSFAKALEAHNRVFPPLFVNMVAAGEASGTLEAVLERLADFMEAQARLKGKVGAALAYPILMTLIGLGLMSVLMVAVVPKVTSIFQSMDHPLPWYTQALILVSGFLASYWWVLAIAIFGGVYSFRRWVRTKEGRLKWDVITLKMPVFGSLIRMIAIARFAKTLSTLLASGVPLLKAMEIVRNVLDNAALERVVETAAGSIREGESIADPLRRSGEFPPIVTHMIAVGEKSGQLENMLASVAESFSSQVEVRVQALTSLLEPLVIVVMGGAVGFIAFAILMPLIQMNEFVQLPPMARRRAHKRTVFLPWERQGGVFRSLGLARARPFVLLLFGGAALVALWGRERHKADVRATRAALVATRRSIDAYRAEHQGACPPGGLDALVAAGYLAAVPLDAWDQRLRIICPSRRPPRPYDLYSDGPDGDPGGLDRVELGMPTHARRFDAMNMSPPSASSLRRARRVLARGVTLIEVLIVVAILSMIAAGVTVAVLPKFKEAAVKNTETNAREIRNAVQRWRGLRGGSDCPSISQLVQDKEIDSASKTDDAWGSPYKVACTEDDVIVSSPGPDKKEGSADDIMVPKGAQRLAMDTPGPLRPRRLAAARRARAFTLIELIVVVALASMLMGGVIMGMGSVTNARLKGAVTMVSSAIRSAYTRASAVSRPMRVVLDLDGSRVWIEEGSDKMLVNDQDPTQTGGADPATEAERAAAEQASKILKGPKIPKPRFRAIKQPGFEEDEPGKPGRGLGGKLRFREIHVFHQAEPLREGRAYLYLWPGGQTEQAYIQIAKSPDADDSGIMTLTVHPLTGKVRVLNGPRTLPMTGVGQETQEREDRGGF